jgi:nucleoside-diphosphate-sugar epimerase
MAFITPVSSLTNSCPEKPGAAHADLQVPDTTKFRAHTGWEPQIKFETTMRDLLEYWRERVRRNESLLSR